MRKLVMLLAVAALVLAACGGGEEETAPAEPAAPPPATSQEAPATTEEPPATTEEAPATTEEPPATTEAPDACAVESLALKNPGQLTVATGNPAFPPWFEGGTQTDDWEFNDPNNGEGFEGAFVYALAEQLGFARDQVVWVPTSFNQSIAPGPKKYDFNIQQIGITRKRARAVDFSDGYYDNAQALVSVQGSAVEGATTLAELKSAKLGVPVGTTSYDFVVEVIQPDVEPAVYDDQAGAIQALKNGQVDGIVTDLYTGFYVRDVELENGIIVGQFPPGDEVEQFGLSFEKDSGLVDCVNQGIAALKEDGTLQAIQDEWLADVGGAPVISG
jgi:polar amino acid transport system substrate-binding protein